MLIMLFTAAVVAGFVDTLAGGGGLITLPALMLAQVPPVHALATNKLQGSFGTLVATLVMLRKKLLNIADIRVVFLYALAGGAIGATIVQFVDARALDVVTPAILAAIAIYFLLAPKAGEVDRAPRIRSTWYERLIVPIIGLYDGMFGPGTGSFFSLAGVSLRGQNLVAATAHAKALNFATNIASLFVFVLGGKVVWTIGGVMMLGQIIGAYAGSMVLAKKRTSFVRPMIVTVCLLMLGRYFWQKGYLTL